MNQREMDVMNDVEYMDYPLTLDLPLVYGQTIESALTINTCDFAIMGIQHCPMADDGSPNFNYSIDWSIQNVRRFYKGSSAPMALMFGSPLTSIWKEFRKPIRVKQQVTLYVKLTNLYVTQPVGVSGVFPVQILFFGYERRQDQ